MLTSSFTKHLEELLSKYKGANVVCGSIFAVAGGSINHSMCLKTNTGNYFLKYNNALLYPGMFESEARGLHLLRSKNNIGIPETIGTGIYEEKTFILIEFLVSGKRIKNYNEIFGQQLAGLHRNTSNFFGLDHDNYIGSLSQKNNPHISAVTFLREQRFEPQVKLALQKNIIIKREALLFESLYAKLPGIIPDEPVSLLHGDLWNGNVIPGPDGKAWLIDPAIYYGHRETDIAMTKLFGGFDESFYDAYNDAFPLLPGWKERIDLFQLYPLLVHLNLFGRRYWGQIESVLRGHGVK